MTRYTSMALHPKWDVLNPHRHELQKFSILARELQGIFVYEPFCVELPENNFLEGAIVAEHRKVLVDL